MLHITSSTRNGSTSSKACTHKTALVDLAAAAAVAEKLPMGP
jgi:hypothetical protein